MRLVEVPSIAIEKLEVPPFTIDETQNEPVFFTGRRTYLNVFIQLEEGDEVDFGHEIPHLNIDPYHFYRITPFRWESRDQKIVEYVVVGRFEIL